LKSLITISSDVAHYLPHLVLGVFEFFQFCAGKLFPNLSFDCMSLCLGCIIGERLENGVGRDILEESFFLTELEVLVHCRFHYL
jgi:hypothetical protein